jgi:hypothetical protein
MVNSSPQITTTNSAPAFAHRNDVIARGAFGVGIGGEAVLSLRHTDRELAVAHRLERSELVAHGFIKRNVLGAIDFLANGTDLLDERHVVRSELVRLSQTSVADEMREEHRRRVLGDKPD